nr:VWA domain-containing protein [Planctomycetota bacterium]
MTWVTPSTGLLLGAILIPLLLLLYFLRLRRQPVRISSTMLWVGAVEDLHANSPFQRLRPSLLLLLQLIALVLVLFSLMQPQLEGGSPKQGKHVLLIDRSASMATKNENGVSRFEEAKEQAVSLVEKLHGGGLFSGGSGETMVIAFSDSAEIVIPFTDSQQQLVKAIHAIAPTHGTSRIDDALKLARAYATNTDPEQNGLPLTESAQLELFSDGTISDLESQALQRGETLRYHRLGDGFDTNIGISTISAKRVSEASEEVQIFLSLINTGSEVVTTDIEVSVDGIPIGMQQVVIPAATEKSSGSTSVVFVPFSMPSGGVVHAVLKSSDSLEVDDVSSLVIAPPKELNVLLSENGHGLVRTILEGMPLASLRVVDPSTLQKMVASGESDAFDVVIIRDVSLPLLPKGSYLIFGAPPPVEAFATHVDGEAQVMLVAKENHPVMRFVRFEDIVVSKGYEIITDGNVEILLEGSGWPAVMSLRDRGIQVVYAAFDPLESNWPYLRSFPFFVYNTVQFLGRSGDALQSATRSVGETIRVAVPNGISSVTLRDPLGNEHDVQVDANQGANWGPIRLSGQHTVSW